MQQGQSLLAATSAFMCSQLYTRLEVAKLQNLIAKRNDAEAVMFGHLQRLGYVG